MDTRSWLLSQIRNSNHPNDPALCQMALFGHRKLKINSSKTLLHASILSFKGRAMDPQTFRHGGIIDLKTYYQNLKRTQH